MIEQQLYARSSHGYFLNGPGYDTVRFSNGIKSDEAKANNELFAYNGKDVNGLTEWIQIISRQILKNGDIMLNGSNPYRYMAFDGLKEAFISHSYIIKKGTGDYEDQAHDIRQIAGVSNFISDHDDGSNEPLEQLIMLPVKGNYPESEYVKFIKGKFKKDFILKIIYAVMKSVESQKKVYLIPEDVEDIQTILDILKTIYFYIPYSLRNKIGYITLLNNQMIPAGVNIAFIPQANADLAKAARLYDVNISSDFCFDLRTQEIVFNGELDFNENIEYMRFLNYVYDKDVDISKYLIFIEKQVGNKDTIKNIELTIKFIMECIGDKSIEKIIDFYAEIVKTFDKDESLQKVINLIDLAVKANNGNFSVSEVKAIVMLYDMVDEITRYKLVEYVRLAINSSTGDVKTFFEKIDACSESTISEVILSEFIIPNDEAVKLYYEKVFSSCVSITDVARKINSIERNRIAIDDKLLDKNAFLTVILSRVVAIFHENNGLKATVELADGIKIIKTSAVVNVLKKCLKERLFEFKTKYKVHKVPIQHLEIISSKLSDYMDADYVKEADLILSFFNSIPGHNEDKKIAYLFSNGEKNKKKIIGELSDAFNSHFKKNPIKQHYLAYSVSHFYVDDEYLDIKRALYQIDNQDDIVNYARWLVSSMRYIDPGVKIRSSKGTDKVIEKYEDFANALLISLAKAKGESNPKKSTEYFETLKTIMRPKTPESKLVYDEFVRVLKRALSGKSVPEISYLSLVAARDAKVAKAEKGKGGGQQKSFPRGYKGSGDRNNGKNQERISFGAILQNKNLIVIIAIAIVSVAIIVGLICWLIPKNKDDTVKETTTISTTQNAEEKTLPKNETLTNKNSSTESEAGQNANTTTDIVAIGSSEDSLIEEAQENSTERNIQNVQNIDSGIQNDIGN